jgi:CubicO group peptidase (beta-lactamase class C family)
MMKTTSLFLLSMLMASRLLSQAVVDCPKDSLRAWMQRYHVPAVGIGIIENGKIKSVKVYGDIRPNVPGPTNTIWNIASMTKPVTALTALKLADKGLLNIDEPLSDWYADPDIKDNPWTKELTTHIMLSHQSGFLNWAKMEPDKKLKFHFEPGHGWRYSGMGYEYLRLALENKFHKSLQQLAREEVFDPLGMKDTHLGWSDQIDSNRFAWAYDTLGGQITYLYKQVNAADWMLTTVGDYCKFALSVMKGAGLSKNIYYEMTSIQAHFDTTARRKDEGMGLGWRVINGLNNGEFALTHDGNDPGIATTGILFPKSGRGIIIFTNGEMGDLLYSKILKYSFPDQQAALAKYMEEFR